jgi:sporulation protein YlmC with PRC-barrel domain
MLTKILKMKQSILTAIATCAILGTSLVYADTRQGLLRASALDGKNVTDTQGNNIGEIKRVLIDPTNGRVRYMVVEVDKAWNWNDPEVAVPFQSYQIKRSGDQDVKVTLDATKEKLEKAPKFKEGDADRIYDQSAAEPIYSYWSVIWFEDEQSPEATGGSQVQQSAPKTTGGSQVQQSAPQPTPGSTGGTENASKSGSSSMPMESRTTNPQNTPANP